MFLVKDYYRGSDSIQSLCECLCDYKNIPLLHDPVLEKVKFCYKALPHYETFVRKREGEVNQRVEEGEEARRQEQNHKEEQVIGI